MPRISRRLTRQEAQELVGLLQRVGRTVIGAGQGQHCVRSKYICAVVFLSCGHRGVAQRGMGVYSLRSAPDVTQS